MLTWTRSVSFINARVMVPEGVASSVRFSRHVLAIDAPPRRGDVVVDLDGAFVLPGLINAHDHLELNHYGRLKCRVRYENASTWIDDLRPALREDSRIRESREFPLEARLFVGGLKNVLAGVTTVAHHNPRYREIGRSFPVKVVRRYGWAHSFSLERQPVGAHGEPGGDVRERCLGTPHSFPFVIHVAEGVDGAAQTELSRLESLGCLRHNTVLVHGVALTPAQWERVVAHGASLVWCPASNAFLFGRTAPVRQFLDASHSAADHVCLGSDSRVTGARDLLDELRAAAALVPIAPRELLRMVTSAPARILKLPDAGRIVHGAPADLIVVPAVRDEAAHTLLATSRRDILLVTIDGRPVLGSSVFGALFAARKITPRRIAVDGVTRLADPRLERGIARCPIRESGVECVA